MMKKLVFLLPFLCIGLIFTACEDESDITVVVDGILRYDGPNSTAPLLDAGTYEAAARFTSALTSSLEGQSLTTVSYYLVDTPVYAEVRVYGRGRTSEPGSLLYTADVTPEMNANSWNEHQLNTPVALDGRDLWVAIYLEHSAATQSIGCDAGPTINNAGDWLYEARDGEWRTFTERSGANINWNIRATVQ